MSFFYSQITYAPNPLSKWTQHCFFFSYVLLTCFEKGDVVKNITIIISHCVFSFSQLTNAAMTDVCLRTIFDLLCKYGLDVFGINPNIDEYLQPTGRQRITDGSSLFRTNVDIRDISGE